MNLLDAVDIPSLTIIKYPDPRLRMPGETVTQFDERLHALIEKMFELMYKGNGVGLAAQQVGLPLRLFVANPTLADDDERVYVNPELIELSGTAEAEEGCLSLPNLSVSIKRAAVVTIRAMDAEGNVFEETGEDLLARIFQHETDHTEGRLIADRMSPIAKIANRRLLKELEETFASS
ncbi:MAG: peptide deformylase [Planctomycetes bacterium]|nr:peptide deformylase [Planctomycetota bacterium]